MKHMMRIPLLVVLGLVLVPASALGGGYATAGLSSTPAGVEPGQPWKVDITILQHGQTPMTDVEPAVVVRGPDGTTERFPGARTDTPGVYRAEVVFPAAGRYTYEVDDGFTNAVAHTFPPVEIKPASAAAGTAGSGDGTPLWPFLAGAALLLAGGAALMLRRRSSSPMPA